MEKNNRTDLYRLKIGDRFYFASDKTKKVWQLVKFSSNEGKHWLHGDRSYSADVEVKDDNNQKKFSKGTTTVIFLRHTTMATA
jgi:hypothetical protein